MDCMFRCFFHDVNGGGELGYITTNSWWVCHFLHTSDENNIPSEVGEGIIKA